MLHRGVLLLLLSFTCVVVGQEDELSEPREDLCKDVECKPGEICQDGRCACRDSCPGDWNNYERQLCVDGTTYRHECDLWRNQCYCRTNDPRCGSEAFNGHRASESSVINYFAECQEFSGLCDWEQQGDTFSTRLAIWFQELLRQKWASGTGYSDDSSLLRPMDTKARSATSKMMSSGGPDTIIPGVVSYWFCEMDRKNKGSLDGSDLSLLKQILLPATPCLETFLSHCSASSSISFAQWHDCFGVPPEDRMECSRFK
ncbi:unnamed protein product [Calicophoron daubneyi]|uniref:SPARC/Testican calcium-binding domain-containing protein n=1 Tax=Calicophoron daubneyi TaxID=300641 RepID=A0AAV2TG69_CALDB